MGRFWGRPRLGGGGALDALIEALQPSRAVTVAEQDAQRAGVYGDRRHSAGGAELVLATDEPPWLPAGSRAEVWRSDTAPSPTGLVRLLLRQGDSVFCVPRTDGRADLPTRQVPPDDPDGRRTALELGRVVLGPEGRVHGPVGFVRNLVRWTAPDYPWPRPQAHFTVWVASGIPVVDGEWVRLRAPSPLRDRHWFPLLDG